MFLHVDLDAFFASVEQLLNPDLRGLPVIVAGVGRRGVVSAASYEARAYGVRSAMPTAVARQRCPMGVYVQPRHGEYTRYSERVMEILRDITPEVEQLSIDEAFLAVDGVRRLHGDAVTVAHLVRRRVRDEVGLAISVGVATTKFLAKIASDLAKPDGLLVVAPGTELEFLHPLPAQRLWGVGPKTLEKLARIGIHTIGDLAALPVEVLHRALGRASGDHLHALAHNQDPRPVVTDRDTKSIGNEETYAFDLVDRLAVERELRRLADRVSARLRAAGVASRVVSVKARYGDFTTITRSRTLSEPTNQSAVVIDTARELARDFDCDRGVRLLGIHCSRLEAPSDTHQGVLDLGMAMTQSVAGSVDTERAEQSLAVTAPAHDERQEVLDSVVDQVRARFGNAAVQRATFIPNPRPPGDAS